MDINDLRKTPKKKKKKTLQEKLNTIIMYMNRIEEELDGIAGDLERIQRFENLQGDMKHFVDQAHNLTCTAMSAIEEARIFISE